MLVKFYYFIQTKVFSPSKFRFLYYKRHTHFLPKPKLKTAFSLCARVEDPKLADPAAPLEDEHKNQLEGRSVVKCSVV